MSLEHSAERECAEVDVPDTVMEPVFITIVSSMVLIYVLYVATLVFRADFYSRSQKTWQLLLAVLVPLIGTGLVHWFHSLHRAPPEKVDHALTPQHLDPPPF
jgi:high-affinity K+ transport system ATPase subunit B